MPGPKHPQEAQVIHRLERASLYAVDRVGRQCLGREGGGARVRDRVGGRETAEPVADPVGVAGPEDHADAALDDGGEGWEEVAGVWEWWYVSWTFLWREKEIGLTIACGGEFVVGCIWALGVGCFGTNSASDRWLM